MLTRGSAVEMEKQQQPDGREHTIKGQTYELGIDRGNDGLEFFLGEILVELHDILRIEDKPNPKHE